jgi:C1A family cysteine protease
MKTVAIIALVGVAAAAFFAMSSGPAYGVENQFQDFLSTYRVGYGTTEEYSYRLGVFASNLEKIEELNRANPDATFAVNEFADRTPEEMQQRMGLIVPASVNTNAAYVAPRNGDNIDWSSNWSAVKNQGSCGSCWAFSATAAFEARYALAHGTKSFDELFAEQELVDCDPQSNGCNGGWMDYAFEYLQKQAFCHEDQYAYTARDGTCQVSKCAGGPSDRAYTDLPAKNEDAVLAELANGPISVAVDASTWSFYSGGVMKSCGTGLNHGVTLVAANYDEQSVTIRNSWGGSWGEKGHIRLAMGQDTCGYTQVASYPTF